MVNVGKNVFKQLESLSDRERTEFLDNIKLFTRNQTLIRLSELIISEAKNKKGQWQGPKGEVLETWLWKKLGKSGSFKRNILSTDFNRLKDVIDQYFAFLNLRNSQIEMRIAALKEYSRRKNSDLVSGQVSSVRKLLDESDLLSYLKEVEVGLLEAEELVEGLKRKKNRKFADLIRTLSEAESSLQNAWEVGSSMLETIQVHAGFLFNEPIESDIGGRGQRDNPAPGLYRKLTKVIKSWEANDRLPTPNGLLELREIRKALFSSEGDLSSKDIYELYTMLIALLVPLVNHGVEGADREFLRTQQNAYEKKYLEEDGKMDAKVFKTLVEFSLDYGDIEFAEQVLDQYGREASLQWKDDQGRNDARSILVLLDYIQARMCLVKGDYRKALKLSSQAGLEDSLFVFSQRWVEILACYYLEDYDFCISRINSF